MRSIWARIAAPRTRKKAKKESRNGARTSRARRGREPMPTIRKRAWTRRRCPARTWPVPAPRLPRPFPPRRRTTPRWATLRLLQRRHGQNEPRRPDYRPFITRHDETIAAEELCEPEELDRLRSYLDKQLSHLQGVVARLANRLQRRL